MGTIYKRRIYCETDGQWEYSFNETALTTCPVNAGHTVTSGSENTIGTYTKNNISFTDTPYFANDRVVVVDTSGGNVVVNLPAASRTVDMTVIVKKDTDDVNTVTIDPNNTEIIGGATTQTLTSDQEIVIARSNGSSWDLQSIGDDLTVLNPITQATLVNITRTKGSMIIDTGLDSRELQPGSDGKFFKTNSGVTEGAEWVDFDASDVKSGTFADARIPESSVTQHVGSIDHNSLNNVTVGDVHTQYIALTGRVGGQTLTGGTAAGNNLTLQSTSNASKGTIQCLDPLDVTGNITVSGNVDGRDVAADGLAQDSHIANTSNPHSVTKTQVGLGNLANIFSKYDGTAAPTANDDNANTSGNGTFSVGSTWIDITNDKSYQCVDDSSTSAIWKETSPQPGSGESNTASSAGGTSLVLPKSGVDLPFKGLTSSSGKISLAANANDVGIDVSEANLTLNNIGGTLSVSKGGTGANTLTSGNFLTGNGTGAVVTTKVVPNGDVVGTTDVQTLTNKTITATTNSVRASELATTGTSVQLGSAPPTTGQVLTATSATTANWQNVTASSSFDVQSVTSSVTNTITSATYVDINAMTLTTSNSGTGNYMILFNCSYVNDDKSNRNDFIININGTDQTITERFSSQRHADQNFIISLIHYEAAISNNIIVKIRARTDDGNLSILKRELIIQQVG